MAPLKLSVDVQGLEVFQQVAESLKQIVEDERVPLCVREEYKEKVIQLLVNHSA